MIRDVVVWAGLPDPASNRKLVQAQSDTAKNALAMLLEAWGRAQSRLAHHRGQGEPEWMSAAQAIEVSAHDPLLLEAIDSFCPRATPNSLGRRLGKVRNRNVGGMKFASRQDRKKRSIWAVVDTGDGRPVHLVDETADSAEDCVIDLVGRMSPKDNDDDEVIEDPTTAHVDFDALEQAIEEIG